MWPAHVLYNDLRHFFRTCDARSRISDAYQDVEGRAKSIDPFLAHRRVITYLIDGVDIGLDGAPLEEADHISRVPAREYYLDKRGSFALGDGAADQA